MSAPRPTAAVPSTIWACGRDLPDRSDLWPTPVLRRAVAEFSQPNARVVLLAASPGRKLAARRARTALTATGRSVSALTIADSPARPARGEVADLVIASLLPDRHSPPPHDIHTRLAFTAADQLRGGAILAVLTRCSHTPTGLLDDATGPVVAAAQAADLLYLSHIVAVPLHDDTVTAPTAIDGLDGPRHHVVHIDVTVFLRPADQHQAAALDHAA
ncbi:hypothetical protein [Nocardia otitidiscaviarum]|uniref:hypothetical protein n=1 Tax=Nocardia otitidiscaviarum TaxID=1823 RepID=UPI001895463A|nr:hypothetical protein [Nocardia otitidiscaviarum]MBF6183369.1 hypothetical protein [Nocardia otitidiscaviarum]